MYRLIRPLAFALPAEAAHHLGIGMLELLSAAPQFCQLLRERTSPQTDLSVSVAGLRFPNPVGLAAGLDKNAQAIPGFYALGFGAVEVGTVTPKAQPGNPTPRLFRFPAQRALINRMGFNNLGADEMAARLRELTFRPAPLGVNIGKNKDTPLDRAADDYRICARKLGPLADYVVINASSPNTPGLRQLQEPEALRSLLNTVRSELSGKPLFLKIAPDLTDEAVDAVVEAAQACKMDGLIATNTTVERPFPTSQAGGLSGAPLREKSTAIIRRAFLASKGSLPIIGVGGVFNASDAYEKIRAGASFVQVYTGFIYEGPGMVSRMLRDIQSMLKRDGFKSVRETIGIDARQVQA